MEFSSYENMQDKRISSSEGGGAKDVQSMTEDPKEQPDASGATQKVVNFRNDEAAPTPADFVGDINMEVSVTADEVMQAGGFGATDGITSILPVARDSTNFEARVLNLRDHEDSEDNIVSHQSDPHKGNDDLEGNGASVNMEASVTSDDVIRAGGFGATDDISSFLPVASDFTDFEANLRGARDYEDLDEKVNHPGLGWTGEAK